MANVTIDFNRGELNNRDADRLLLRLARQAVESTAIDLYKTEPQDWVSIYQLKGKSLPLLYCEVTDPTKHTTSVNQNIILGVRPPGNAELTEAVSDSDTTITIDKVVPFTPPFDIELESEIMTVTAVNSNVLTVTRTTPVAHPIGAELIRAMQNRKINEMPRWQEIDGRFFFALGVPYYPIAPINKIRRSLSGTAIIQATNADWLTIIGRGQDLPEA